MPYYKDINIRRRERRKVRVYELFGSLKTKNLFQIATVLEDLEHNQEELDKRLTSIENKINLIDHYSL